MWMQNVALNEEQCLLRSPVSVAMLRLTSEYKYIYVYDMNVYNFIVQIMQTTLNIPAEMQITVSIK